MRSASSRATCLRMRAKKSNFRSAPIARNLTRQICAGLSRINARWRAFIWNRISPADAYSRLLAPNVLPPDWGRVLYLDCDLVFRADASELYDFPDDGNAVHATLDIEVYAAGLPEGVFNHARAGYSRRQPVFQFRRAANEFAAMARGEDRRPGHRLSQASWPGHQDDGSGRLERRAPTIRGRQSTRPGTRTGPPSIPTSGFAWGSRGPNGTA